jgi:hypothetical protein
MVTGDKHVRRWHFGVEAVPILYPLPVLALKPHVVFTLDGKNVIGSARSQHRARRSQCREWWNDKWRDLIFATAAWLSGGSTKVNLQIAPDSELTMDWRPVKYACTASYNDGDVKQPPPELLGEEIDPGEDDVDSDFEETQN